MTFLKTFWPCVLLVLVMIALLFVVTPWWALSILFPVIYVAAAGAANARLDAAAARVFLDHTKPDPIQDVLRDLARDLDNAYEENIALQKGATALIPSVKAADIVDPLRMAAAYAYERRRRARVIKSDIKRANARFWNVARLLDRWGLIGGIPKSYRDFLKQ